jgi:YidC/Oxa1 family membrane protein insertase
MRTEFRFLIAVGLMLVVLVGTNILFPPVQPEPGAPAADSLGVAVESQSLSVDSAAEPELTPSGDPEPTPEIAQDRPAETGEPEAAETQLEDRSYVVQGPLYRFTFNSRGGRMRGVELQEFESFSGEGLVQLIPEDAAGALGLRLLVNADTVDYRDVFFEARPADGLSVMENGGPQSLTLSYAGDAGRPPLEVVYTFQPDSYSVLVEGRVGGVESAVAFIDLGEGLAMNEGRPRDEERSMAYALNHVQEGIRIQNIQNLEEPSLETGPFFWAAFKSKYFVMGALAGSSPDEEDARLGGAVVTPTGIPFRAHVAVTQPLMADGRFVYRLFAGPQDYQILRAQGRDFHNVNAYGWRLFRPIIRPFTGIITTILVFLHENLRLGYGWVLVVFGVLMRIVLFPLNHKAMRAQLRNMAVQPMLQEVQTRYKDDPERMQKELMKLYREHGFNPLAGCLPMLLPWPVLIALFFVFQNTIELRGVPFLWLPDLSAPDPFYVLPVILGLSMFLIQWISLRTMETPNPQMKTMMWIMPIFMLFIFANLASGLNLYYATANLATLPQQYWIAGERKRAQEEMKKSGKATTETKKKEAKKG